jgi:hypothetical protein
MSAPAVSVLDSVPAQNPTNRVDVVRSSAHDGVAA